MTRASQAAGGVLAVVAMLGVGAASHVAMSVHPSPDALLRLAWSARPERIERCRTLGDAALEALPQHMRQRVVCEGSTARYRLDVLRDGERLATAVLRGGGMRHDRQLYVLRELAIPSGPSTIEVRLTRIDSGPSVGDDDRRQASAGHARDGRDGREHDERGHDEGDARHERDEQERDERERDERRRRTEDAMPASLTLRETVTLVPREVVLVTYDGGERRLRFVRRTP